MSEQNNVFPIDPAAPETTEIEKTEEIVNAEQLSTSESQNNDTPVTPPREELEKIIAKVETFKELDEIRESYPELQTGSWFHQALDNRYNQIVMNKFRAEAKKMVEGSKVQFLSLEKKKGFMRLVRINRQEVIYGYGEIHLNQSVKIHVFYGNVFLPSGSFQILPASDWSICMANDEAQFIEWLASNDYQNYLSEKEEAENARNQKKVKDTEVQLREIIQSQEDKYQNDMKALDNSLNEVIAERNDKITKYKGYTKELLELLKEFVNHPIKSFLGIIFRSNDTGKALILLEIEEQLKELNEEIK
jgi:hypothetical protein